VRVEVVIAPRVNGNQSRHAVSVERHDKVERVQPILICVEGVDWHFQNDICTLKEEYENKVRVEVVIAPRVNGNQSRHAVSVERHVGVSLIVNDFHSHFSTFSPEGLAV
jgi:hypothetical protein